MDYHWITLEPVQVLQSIIAEPVALVSGRPFLVRGYVQFENRGKRMEARLEVSVIDTSTGDKRPMDKTRHPIIATIDVSTVEYLEQTNLNEDEYLQLSRNTLSNSLNWFIQPEDFEKNLLHLDPGKNYLLQLEASGEFDTVPFSNRRAVEQNRPAPLGSYNKLEPTAFGQDFGAYYIRRDSELRVNVLGLRYRDPDGEVEFPTVDDHHFARAQSYLAASFPVGALYWTSLNLHAPARFSPPFTNGRRAGTDYRLQTHIDTANAFIAAVRANDINIGVDQRTLYYGMMDVADNEFEGAASDVPAVPSHLAVAVGPADNTTGYYCAHELAHMLGQTHQGGVNQEAENFHDWLTRPRRASNSRRDDLLLRMDRDGIHQERFPWKNTVDLMSYGERTWPSCGTYFELQQRLEALARQSQKHSPQHDSNTRVVFVSGTYDLHAGTGQIEFVLPLLQHSEFEAEVNHRSQAIVQVNETLQEEEADVSPEIRLTILRGNDQTPVQIASKNLLTRRKSLDFPSETGMFQALISVDDFQINTQSSINEPPYWLTLVRETTVVDPTGVSHRANTTQLDQVELALVPESHPQIYGRIRPSEIDLRQSEDGFGYYLRIDKQLNAAELLDCFFIVEIPTYKNEDVWRTVALNVRAGEDVFLDARLKGVLHLTESVQQRDQHAASIAFQHSGEFDSQSQTSDILSGDLHTGPQRNDQERLQLDESSLPNNDIELASRSRTFMARIRIIATRGLDKVIVFDGLLAESTIREDRAISISIDRRHRVQHFQANGNFTPEDVQQEDRIINNLLRESRHIISAIEGVVDRVPAPLGEPIIDAVLSQFVTQSKYSSQTANSKSGELKVIPRELEKTADPDRTVYYSVK